MKRWLVGAVLIAIPSSLLSQPLNSSPKSYYKSMAEAWAPTLVQDYAPEFTSALTGFNPVDHLLDLFFDGNQDLRDNAENVFRLSAKQTESIMDSPTLYYSVAETKTHYYINYVVYHAVDMNGFGHAHDTENIWTIVEKDGSSYGRLVAQVSNVHGFPNIYAPNVVEQEKWRSRLPHWNWKRRLMSAIDRHSASHEVGTPEYIQRAGSQSFMAFISSRSHAIYKFNREAWQSGESGSGAVYVSQDCGECLVSVATLRADRIYRYQLKDWDEIYRKYVDAPNEGVFVSDAWGLLKSVKEENRPKFLAAGWGENKAVVNLFYTIKFKTPYSLADPASVHRFFEGSSTGISEVYLYNPYLGTAPKQSVWTAAFFSSSF